MVNGQDFHCISRKKAAEVLRSCDQLSVTMEISRIISKLKPRAVVRSLYIYSGTSLIQTPMGQKKVGVSL